MTATQLRGGALGVIDGSAVSLGQVCDRILPEVYVFTDQRTFVVDRAAFLVDGSAYYRGVVRIASDEGQAAVILEDAAVRTAGFPFAVSVQGVAIQLNGERFTVMTLSSSSARISL